MPHTTNFSFRIVPDHRGSISSGRRTESGRPEGLGHWDITDFPELLEVYGDTPSDLLVIPASDDFQLVSGSQYNRWGNGQCLRTCDRSVCTHRVNETLNDTQYPEGQSECVCAALPKDFKGACKYNGWIYVMVLDPESRRLLSPSVFMVKTTSENNHSRVASALNRGLMFAKANGIPYHKLHFLLSVKKVPGKERGKMYPRWYMDYCPVGKPIEPPHKPPTVTPSTPPTATNGVGADGDATGITQPHSQRAAQANAAAGDSLRQTPQPTSPSATAVVANGSENPPPVPPVENWIAEYDEVGRQLYNGEWPNKRGEHLRNRTDCQGATRGMKCILRKRELGLTSEEWQGLLKKAKLTRVELLTDGEFNRLMTLMNKMRD